MKQAHVHATVRLPAVIRQHLLSETLTTHLQKQAEDASTIASADKHHQIADDKDAGLADQLAAKTAEERERKHAQLSRFIANAKAEQKRLCAAIQSHNSRLPATAMPVTLPAQPVHKLSLSSGVKVKVA